MRGSCQFKGSLGSFAGSGLQLQLFRKGSKMPLQPFLLSYGCIHRFVPEFDYCVTACSFTSDTVAKSISFLYFVAASLFIPEDTTSYSEGEELPVLEGIDSGLGISSTSTRKACTSSQYGYVQGSVHLETLHRDACEDARR